MQKEKIRFVIFSPNKILCEFPDAVQHLK